MEYIFTCSKLHLPTHNSSRIHVERQVADVPPHLAFQDLQSPFIRSVSVQQSRWNGTRHIRICYEPRRIVRTCADLELTLNEDRGRSHQRQLRSRTHRQRDVTSDDEVSCDVVLLIWKKSERCFEESGQ